MKIHIGECCQHDNKQAGIGIQTGPEMFMVIHSHLLKKFSLKTKETNDPRTENVHYHKNSGISYASKCQKYLINMAETKHVSQCQLKWPVTLWFIT